MKKIGPAALKKILGRFPRVRILVVGDLMLDRFVWGSVTRISPEAPVPVVEVTSESDIPGGAANVVNNIQALGGRAHVCGVIGRDRIGEILRDKLSRERVHLDGIVVMPGRTTTLKTRIIAHSQQVVRVDKETTARMGEREIERLIAHARSLAGGLDAIIIEDYGKGLVTQRLVGELLGLARERGIVVAVDPKIGHPIDYHGATVITPNRAEAFWLAGAAPGGAGAIEAVGRKLLNELDLKGVLITLGEQGMCLFREGKPPSAIPTTAREVYDVSGAGDTVISAFTLALAAGASMEEAAIVANYAAGVVVGKVGTATATRAEIAGAMDP